MENELSVYYAIIAVMLGFVIITGGVIALFTRYQKSLRIKQEKIHEMDSRYKKELLLNSIQSAEAERMRIAKDIHDEIGSIFSTLSLSVGQMKHESNVAEQLTVSKGLIQSGIDSVRRIAHGIVPFELELLGLDETLHNHFDAISSASAIEIRVDNACDDALLQEETALSIYRILQELSSNSIKHGKPSAIAVQITETDGSVIVHYKDDGAGIDLEKQQLKKGIGLKNIESRVVSLDGSVRFSSEPGKGFACEIRIPLLPKSPK